MKINPIFAVLIIFVLQSPVFGDTVELLTGNVLEGEIVERNDDHIKLEAIDGMPVTYYLDEIKRINGKDVVVQTEKIIAQEP